MRIKKRLSALLFTLLLCCAFCVPAYAHEVPDMTKAGSITASMTYEGEAVGGGSLTFYRVGDVSEDDGNYSFTLTEDFAGSGLALDNIADAALAEDLAEYADANRISGTTVEIGSDGQVTADNLTLGLYLAVQTEAADGYEAVSPFLVSVPMYENGAYIYNVNAEPKMEPLSPSPAAPEEPETPAEPSPGTKLPQTGQLNWPVPVLTVLGLCLILAGWELRVGKQSYEA